MSNRWTAEDIERVKQAKTVCKTFKKYSSKAQKNIPAISANALTKHALRILDLCGFKVWRQNNGGVYDPTRKIFRANSSTPGISDIIGFHKKTSQFIACEIKAGKDRLSEDQKMFIDAVNKSGGIGIVVRSIDDLESFLKKNVQS